MQIVRDLGGYTMGRSDLVRRAMSKKKTYVMEQERNNFVHGNKEEGVPGCEANGISAEVAEQIYGTMMDFAKYAFNKSHAACYAVVAYQTAYLKYYYPVEFMAALLTSVIDNNAKVTEYILTCRNMGIKILPPDINEGVAGFSVSGDSIRYGLNAIKSVGKPVIDAIVNERTEHGSYKTLKSFMERKLECGVNKRTIENFIKAGAFDSFGATRKQHMTVYNFMLDSITSSKKTVISGQMSLLDIVPEEQRDELEIRLPNVGEYEKAELLLFEKEVLGFYVSGHPLEEYQALWEKNITAKTSDFLLDDETGLAHINDKATVTIGGIINEKKIRYTKNNQIMAILTLEDLVGTVEVIVFPKAYEKYSSKIVEENKVFIEGRVSLEEERDGKLMCEKITSFNEIPRNVWIKFPNMKAYVDNEIRLYEAIHDSEGIDRVTIYIEETRQKKVLPPNKNIKAEAKIIEKLGSIFGEHNIRVI
jgi:DNA polymerase-3 subunit alpha